MDNQELQKVVRENLRTVKKEKKKKQTAKTWTQTIIDILEPVVIVFIILRFIVGVSPLYGSSMEPTLYEGDWVVYNRLDKNLERGDIVIAEKPEDDILIIKRVIGVPGDTVDIKDNVVYVNGEVLPEDYTLGETVLHDVTFPQTLGENEYFVLGDHRDVSLDSRSSKTGNVNKSHILGKMISFFRTKPKH